MLTSQGEWGSFKQYVTDSANNGPKYRAINGKFYKLNELLDSDFHLRDKKHSCVRKMSISLQTRASIHTGPGIKFTISKIRL